MDHVEANETNMTREEPRTLKEDSLYFVTFTDLIYAILLGYGISLLHHGVLEKQVGPVLLVMFSLILVVYDWYGTHLLDPRRRAGVASVILDFVAFFIYFGVLLSSAQSSFYLFLFLAARAARGLLHDLLVLQKLPKPPEKIKLQAWTISSTSMLISYSDNTGDLPPRVVPGSMLVGVHVPVVVEVCLA